MEINMVVLKRKINLREAILFSLRTILLLPITPLFPTSYKLSPAHLPQPSPLCHQEAINHLLAGINLLHSCNSFHVKQETLKAHLHNICTTINNKFGTKLSTRA